MQASRVLKDLKGKNMDQNTGIKIVAEALKIPCITICKNAGLPGELIAHQLLELDNNSIGINAQTGEKCDLFEKGIIDPTKVVRTAIVGAVRVASLMITTEAMVVNVNEKDKTDSNEHSHDDMD